MFIFMFPNMVLSENEYPSADYETEVAKWKVIIYAQMNFNGQELN